jgi:uncharacterized protein (DUF1800 family)
MSTETEAPQDQSSGDSRRARPRGRAADPRWAFAPYVPDAQRPWNLRWAGHLFRRAAFGATWDELQRAVAAGPQRTIDRLLHPEGDVAAFQRACDENEAGTDDLETARAWWLRRMLLTPHPRLEKLTLFWHGHFAASIDKVDRVGMMVRQIQLLRSHALGRFDAMLLAVARDPAMLVWLDAAANHKALPSQAIAQTFLETYTLGQGVCSPRDVREAARAFSGSVLIQGKLRRIEREHDAGVKDVLGHRGNWTGDDVLGFALAHPATPRLVVRKLYRWLISESELPDDEYLAVLGEPLAKDYDVARLVETMLRSNLFFSPAAYRQRIKSPVEYALGIARAMEQIVPTMPLGHDLAGLGQGLYEPPGADGWAGGRAWINAATMLARNKLAAVMLSGSGRYGEAIDPAVVAGKHGCAAGFRRPRRRRRPARFRLPCVRRGAARQPADRVAGPRAVGVRGRRVSVVPTGGHAPHGRPTDPRRSGDPHLLHRAWRAESGRLRQPCRPAR